MLQQNPLPLMSNNFVTFATSSILKSEGKLANLMNESMSD